MEIVWLHALQAADKMYVLDTKGKIYEMNWVLLCWDL